MGLLIGIPLGIIVFITLLNIDNAICYLMKKMKEKKCEKKDTKVS